MLALGYSCVFSHCCHPNIYICKFCARGLSNTPEARFTHRKNGTIAMSGYETPGVRLRTGQGPSRLEIRNLGSLGKCLSSVSLRPSYGKQKPLFKQLPSAGILGYVRRQAFSDSRADFLSHGFRARGLGFRPGKAKADAFEEEARFVAGPEGRTTFVGYIAPGPASFDAEGAAGRTNRVVIGILTALVVIGIIPITAQLPDVTVHIIQPPCIGAEASYIRGFFPTHSICRPAVWKVAIEVCLR